MKLIFLGSGSAFTVNADNYHSNMVLVNENDEKLLIDCGSDARFSLAALGYSYQDIQDVYISHLHADHAGGLEWLGFSHLFDANCQRPNLHISENLLASLWTNVLAGGMGSLQGNIANIDTYFNPQVISKNGVFHWSDIEIRLVQTVHIMNGFSIVPSYGLLFPVANKKIFITTDTQFCPHQIMDFYQMADIIFQDCETSQKMSGVHAHYQELVTLEAELKHKMWLYHYNPGTLPNAEQDGFKGFVKKGQVFDFSDPTLYL